ncbi:MAG: hypothetical protein NTX82_04935 [Candidatus Parcubacteria bacterium]|nr:hypothetical protein [Candidatus Parcubacteria bacterium]
MSKIEPCLELQEAIEKFVGYGVKIVTPEVAVMKDKRLEYGSSGGTAYFDQIRVFYKEQSLMKEWQWRDRYSASNDRYDLAVHDIGAVNVDETDGKVKVEVEIINNKYGNRQAIFTFEKTEISRPRLSAQEQESFKNKVKAEVERIMKAHYNRWENRCHLNLIRCPAYKEPLLSQEKIWAEYGIAAFVIVEQIDHAASDPQMRHLLYLLTAQQPVAEMKSENHGYVKAEGGSMLAIIDLQPDGLLISSKAGKSLIKL